MKIVSTGGTISTETFLERKRMARRKSLIFLFFSLLILLVLVVVISRLERFRISNIAVTGADVIGANVVTEFSKNVIAGNYLWLVPRDNALVYPRGELKEALMRKIPRFSSIALSLDSLNKLNVDVVEREPFALYCGDATTTEGRACYFLDDGGFIFDLAPSFSDGVYFVYASNEPVEDPRGRQFLPPEEFKLLAQFIENLSDLGVQSIALKLSGEDFDLSSHNGMHILWKREADTAIIYSNLESFLMSEAIRAQTDFLEKASELDLRTENKVFYTFK